MAIAGVTDQVGRVLEGRYRLVSVIGLGASARVYAADDVDLGRSVAVKLLHPGLRDDAPFLRRFRAEARAAAALNHPHVTMLYDWGVDEGDPYLILELLSGGSLRDILDQAGTLSRPQVARIGAQAARGLAYAHARGLVHRDVKPANLLFDEEGRMRIADFGIARALSEAAWTEPMGSILGTARYVSPEQAQGGAVDGRSDVYALAITLYEALTGETPFNADTTLGTLMRRVGARLPDHPALGELAPVLSEAAEPSAADRMTAAMLGERLDAMDSALGPHEPLPLAREVSPRGMSGQGSGQSSAAGAPTQQWGDPEVLSPVPAVSPAVRDTAIGARREPQGDAPVTRRAIGRVHHTGLRRRSLVAVIVACLACVVALMAASAAGLFVTRRHVPAVTDMTLASARHRMAAAGFKLRVVSRRHDAAIGAGKVISESPRGGANVVAGSTVMVVLSLGTPVVPVPSLSGLTETAAVAAVTRAGLVASTAFTYSATTQPQTVVSWSPTGSLPEGATVTIEISKGPAPPTVPDLAGLPWTSAAQVLTGDGLVPVEVLVSTDLFVAGEVVATDPLAGETVSPGATIVVEVSQGRSASASGNAPGPTKHGHPG